MRLTVNKEYIGLFDDIPNNLDKQVGVIYSSHKTDKCVGVGYHYIHPDYERLTKFSSFLGNSNIVKKFKDLKIDDIVVKRDGTVGILTMTGTVSLKELLDCIYSVYKPSKIDVDYNNEDFMTLSFLGDDHV